jgi:hypothetical protein
MFQNQTPWQDAPSFQFPQDFRPSLAVIAPVLWAGAYRDGKRHRKQEQARSSGETIRESSFGTRVGFTVASRALLAATEAACSGGLALPGYFGDAAEAIDNAF